MKFKAERIKTLIQQEILNLIATGSISDPRVPAFITITRITLSKDLHYAHIYFFTINEDKAKIAEATAGLNHATGFFQKHIAQNLGLRFTPKIEFRYDEIEEKANKVEQLISQLSASRPNDDNDDNNES